MMDFKIARQITYLTYRFSIHLKRLTMDTVFPLVPILFVITGFILKGTTGSVVIVVCVT